MAVEYIASGARSNVLNGPTTPGIPPGMVAGDVLALVDEANTSVTSIEAAPTIPGWEMVDTFIGATTNDLNGDGRTRLTLYLAEWTEGMEVPSIPFDGSVITAPHYSRIHGLRGVKLSDPTDVLGVATVSAPSGSVIAGIKGVDVSADGGFVLVIAACSNNHSAAGETNSANTLTGDGLTWSKIDEFAYTSGIDMSMIVQAASVPTARTITDKDMGIFSGSLQAVTRMWSFNAASAEAPPPAPPPPAVTELAEDFEDDTYAFPIGGTWGRSQQSVDTGSWALRSDTLGHNSTTDAVVTVPADATAVRFRYRVSSESGYDYFRFLLDGAQQFQEAGAGAWKDSPSYDVTAVDTITFRYTKDSSTVTGDDAAYVDNIIFTLPGPTPAEVHDIGPGPTQNHVKLQMARPGDPTITTISMADLAAGFAEAPYYYTVGDGSLVHMQAAVAGPTTAGSGSTRCEYREVDAAGNDTTWDPATNDHSITVEFTVTSLPPTKPEVVLAQIFNETAGADLASIRTQLVSGTTRLRFRYGGVSVTSPQIVAPYSTGTKVRARMRAVGGVIEVYWVVGGGELPATPQIVTAAVPTGQACYFKAGLYNQSTTSSDDGTAVGASELSELRIAHLDTGPPDPRLTPLYGFDVSHFRAGLDFTAAAADGMSFVLAKVGQGASTSAGYGQSLDPGWPAFRDEAQSIGMPLGGYWYLGDTESAESQAARCRAWMGDRGIPLALDWELGGGDWANFTACVAAFRAAGLTVRLIYTRASYYSANGGGDIAALGLTLWNARYPTINPGTPTELYADVAESLDTYWQSYGGVTAELLQYSDNSTIATMSPVDANAYDGTALEVAALLAPVAQPAPGPAPAGAFLSFFPDRVVV